MIAEAPAGSIVHVIQLAVAPVFLLTGIASMLNVLTNRLARIVDRARRMEEVVAPADADEWQRQLLRRRLQNLALRARVVSWSIALCIGSAVLVGTLVVTLFASSFLQWHLGAAVAAMFIGAMAALIASLILFLREIFLATSQLRIGEPEDPPPPIKT